MDTSKLLNKPSAECYALISDQGQQRTSILFPLQHSDPESSGENYTCGKTLSAVRGSTLMLLRTVPSLLKQHGEKKHPASHIMSICMWYFLPLFQLGHELAEESQQWKENVNSTDSAWTWFYSITVRVKNLNHWLVLHDIYQKKGDT